MLISQAKVVQGERRTKKNLFLFALPSRLFGVAPPCNSCFDGYRPKGIVLYFGFRCLREDFPPKKTDG